MSKDQQTNDARAKKQLINEGPAQKVCWLDFKDEIAIAIEKDNVDFIRTVIDKNTEVDHSNYYVYFLERACKHDAVEVFKYLVEERSVNIWGSMGLYNNADFEVLKAIVYNKSFKILTCIIEKISIPDQVKPWTSIDSKWFLLGDVTIVLDKLDVLKFLFEKGLVIKEIDSTRLSAPHLMSAIAIGNKEIAEYLIKQGADIDEQIKNGLNTISYACISEKLDLVKFLIEQGADCNVTGKTKIKKDIAKYIKIGSYVQSLCSDNKFNNTDESLSAIIEQIQGDALTSFAVTSMKNYILKKKIVSENLLNNIQDCTVLPDAVKASMREAASSFVEDFNEKLESLEGELLYLSSIISLPISRDYSNIKSADFFCDSDIHLLEEINDVYESFQDSGTAGFCIKHFANTDLPGRKISLLECFMKLHPYFKENAQELLDQVTSSEIKIILEKALGCCRYLVLDDAAIEDAITSFQLSSPNLFYPITVQEFAEEKAGCLTLISKDEGTTVAGDVSSDYSGID